VLEYFVGVGRLGLGPPCLLPSSKKETVGLQGGAGLEVIFCLLVSGAVTTAENAKLNPVGGADHTLGRANFGHAREAIRAASKGVQFLLH
jgi:hypothetical protein